MREQNNKIALIAGANRGSGFEMAHQFGQQSIKISGGARTGATTRGHKKKMVAVKYYCESGCITRSE